MALASKTLCLFSAPVCLLWPLLVPITSAAAFAIPDTELSGLNQPAPSLRDQGGHGLLRMPTARMQAQASVAVNFSHVWPYDAYSLTVQPFSWFEAVYRISNIINRKYGAYDFSGDQSYKDKSADVKFRLWPESRYTPQLAVGFQDLIGTGIFAGEYLVASKGFKQFDLTLGLGWGYLAKRRHAGNPLALLNPQLSIRDGDWGEGGLLEWDRLFRGEHVGLFAGLAWLTPWDRLLFKLEYDSNDYRGELEEQTSDTAWNSGFELALPYGLTLDLGWERGQRLMAGINLQLNADPTYDGAPADPPPVILKPTDTRPTVDEQIDWQSLDYQLQSNAGYVNPSLWLLDDTVWLQAEQITYRDRSIARQRAGQIMLNELPGGIEQIVIHETSGPFIGQAEVIKPVSVVVNALAEEVEWSEEALTAAELVAATELPLPPQPAEKPDYQRQQRYSYLFKPELLRSIGGPDAFILWQLGVTADGSWWLNDELELSGNLYAGLLGNFDKFKYTGPSELPRVRTLVRDYLTGNSFRLNQMQLTWFRQWQPELYSQVYIGQMELMYSGLGTEVLYQPVTADWAVGANINAVQQRDFYGFFGLRDYQVVTGHFSHYWQTGWQNLKLSSHWGRYLAKDWGVTLDLSRQFASGTQMGLYATFTDVPAETYGEGSFTKGFYISIPVDLISSRSSRSYFGINYTPLLRDGGQAVARRYHLHNWIEGFRQ